VKRGLSEPGSNLREDRSVRDALEIVGHDVDRQVSGRSEGLRIHVVETG